MNRVALITGGSRGLGRTVAGFLAAQGYDLVITARIKRDLALAAHALRHYGGRVFALAGDVADPAHRRCLADSARELGRLDLLLNNASTLGATPLPPLMEYPLADLEEAFRVNVVAPIALVGEALPLLEASRGLVVNVTSDAARGGYAGWGGYGLTKAALELASLTLANELRGREVGVVTIDPGDLRTRMHQEAFPGEDISDRPLPGVTIPFWAWLFEQPRDSVTGRRYQAQSDRWEVNADLTNANGEAVSPADAASSGADGASRGMDGAGSEMRAARPELDAARSGMNEEGPGMGEAAVG